MLILLLVLLNKNMKLLLFILFLLNTSVLAHQPKLINYSPSLNNPHQVVDPEISKAYYGKLSGEPHLYKIESDIVMISFDINKSGNFYKVF